MTFAKQAGSEPAAAQEPCHARSTYYSVGPGARVSAPSATRRQAVAATSREKEKPAGRRPTQPLSPAPAVCCSEHDARAFDQAQKVKRATPPRSWTRRSPRLSLMGLHSSRARQLIDCSIPPSTAVAVDAGVMYSVVIARRQNPVRYRCRVACGLIVLWVSFHVVTRCH